MPPQGAPPPPPPKKRSILPKVLIGVAVLVIGVGFSIYMLVGRAPKVGTCVNLVDGGDTYSSVSCTASDANYRVDEVRGRNSTCPSVEHAKYGDSGVKSKKRRRGGYTLCLSLNANEGDCFTGSNTIGSAGDLTKTPCGSGTWRTTKVLSTDSVDACGPDAKTSRHYSSPAKTVCLTKK